MIKNIDCVYIMSSKLKSRQLSRLAKGWLDNSCHKIFKDIDSLHLETYELYQHCIRINSYELDGKTIAVNKFVQHNVETERGILEFEQALINKDFSKFTDLCMILPIRKGE